jgi:circadian clock protein KaiC
MIDQGTLHVAEIGPEEWSVDEFTHAVRTEVEDEGAEIVMIDGTTGFLNSLSGLGDDPERHLVRVGRYLRNVGATGIVSNEVHSITGEFRATEQGTSYLADNIVALRHVEYRGELRKVIGVLKMRSSDFETRIRELEITEDGLRIGEPLTDLRGILTGTPDWPDDGEGA